MSKLILASVIVLFLLLVSEYLWRHKKHHSEITRKFAHITIGTFVALWPFFLSWGQIQFLSLTFLVGVIASQYLGIFRAIHSVQRPTWGEILFAIVVGVLAIEVQDKWIYAAALLQMSLADGLAAVVGTQYGKRNKYKVFGYTKSIAGTLTFLAASLFILVLYALVSDKGLALGTILGLALIATAAENVAIKGLDNLIVPLLVAGILIRV